MSSYDFGFGNCGRTNDVDKIRRSLTSLRTALPDGGVLGLVEIDEGDRTKPTDHQLVHEVFTGRRLVHMHDGHEPIILPEKSGMPLAAAPRSIAACTGVPHQSPARAINEVVIAGVDGEPDVAVGVMHYPAGAHNGNRPARVKVQLVDRYARMYAAHRAWVRCHHKAGRHVVWLADVNWRQFPDLLPRHHPGEVDLFHDGPDLGRALPAAGWTVKPGRPTTVPMYIEHMHQGHLVRVHFTKETP